MTAMGMCGMYIMMPAEAHRSTNAADLRSLEVDDKYLSANEQEEIHHMCMRLPLLKSPHAAAAHI